MTFTSVEFLLFLIVGIIVYYILPKKVRWIWLLLLSYTYYFTFSTKTVVFMIFTTLVVFAGGIWLEKINDASEEYLKNNKDTLDKEQKKKYKSETKHKKRLVLLLMILLCFGQLSVLKYTNFAIQNLNSVLGLLGKNAIEPVYLILPLGISFYTFQSVSYVIDIYHAKYRCQRNVFKLALFVSFFPQLMQGPIGRYDRLSDQLYKGNDFNLDNLKFGAQRICWGLFKKLVIADRAAIFVNQVFFNYNEYGGLVYIIAVLLYSVQLYMDFSGGIDVVIGVAEMLGITMDENFRQPYFSKSIGEFWRRWHITLGTWMKDYIFYPMSLSKAMSNFGKWGKKHFGNTIGRVLPICFANLVIFFVVGVWHGASWKFIAYGLYNGFIIAFSNLLEPVYKKLKDKLHINSESKAWSLWCMFRTFILVNIGWYFDMAVDFKAAISMMKWSVLGFRFSQFNSDIFKLGIVQKDFIIILFGCLVVFIVSLLREKHIDVRRSLASKPLVVRWALYYALLLVIIILGSTGTVQTFLYANF